MSNMERDIKNLYKAIEIDCDALEDAQMTFESIKEVLPNVFDKIIDESLALIDEALSICSGEALDRVTKAAILNNNNSIKKTIKKSKIKPEKVWFLCSKCGQKIAQNSLHVCLPQINMNPNVLPTLENWRVFCKMVWEQQDEIKTMQLKLKEQKE